MNHSSWSRPSMHARAVLNMPTRPMTPLWMLPTPSSPQTIDRNNNLLGATMDLNPHNTEFSPYNPCLFALHVLVAAKMREMKDEEFYHKEKHPIVMEWKRDEHQHSSSTPILHFTNIATISAAAINPSHSQNTPKKEKERERDRKNRILVELQPTCDR